eukprot:15452529-Alexandrium_andersonii.AAC.1
MDDIITNQPPKSVPASFIRPRFPSFLPQAAPQAACRPPSLSDHAMGEGWTPDLDARLRALRLAPPWPDAART